MCHKRLGFVGDHSEAGVFLDSCGCILRKSVEARCVANADMRSMAHMCNRVGYGDTDHAPDILISGNHW